MSAPVVQIAVAIGAYVALVVVLGLAATKTAGKSPEEYFLAGRRLGSLVLFMALFGTNATAFVLVGIPGRAYHDGLGIFGVNAPIIALGIPLTFWAIGSPARKMAARLNALTPAELFRKRFGSTTVGVILFLCFTLYTLPYMVTAVKGAALTLTGVTDKGIPEWAGGLGVLAVALLYTTLGGMRATAWTNVLQGALFMTFMVTAFFLMGDSLGGLESATKKVIAHDPALLRVAGDSALFTPKGWISWGLMIALTVIAFPHMLVRLMAGRDEGALKNVCRLYPLALMVLWVPAVMIGIWGATVFPGLEGRASDRIFSLMAAQHLPSWLGAVAFLAVLAAVMSTLDAQILTLSSMLVRDVLDPIRKSEQSDVAAARIFAVAIAGAVYVLSLLWGQSVFEIASIAFSGYVTLTPTLLLGVRWRRFTSQGAIASVVAGNVALLLAYQGVLPLNGWLPVVYGLGTALAAGIVVSWLTTASDEALVRQAFDQAEVQS